MKIPIFAKRTHNVPVTTKWFTLSSSNGFPITRTTRAGKMTVCNIFQKGKLIGNGVAYCSQLDEFDQNEGKRLSLKRALSGLHIEGETTRGEVKSRIMKQLRLLELKEDLEKKARLAQKQLSEKRKKALKPKALDFESVKKMTRTEFLELTPKQKQMATPKKATPKKVAKKATTKRAVKKAAPKKAAATRRKM